MNQHIHTLSFSLNDIGVEARRGRSRGRTKSKVQIGLPITGKYRDPESDQYYNNNNVSNRNKHIVFDMPYVHN
jgi:hypothetical protein